MFSYTSPDTATSKPLIVQLKHHKSLLPNLLSNANHYRVNLTLKYSPVVTTPLECDICREASPQSMRAVADIGSHTRRYTWACTSGRPWFLGRLLLVCPQLPSDFPHRWAGLWTEADKISKSVLQHLFTLNDRIMIHDM